MFDRVLKIPTNVNFEDIQHINLLFYLFILSKSLVAGYIAKILSLDDIGSVPALLFELMSYLSYEIMSCT